MMDGKTKILLLIFFCGLLSIHTLRARTFLFKHYSFKDGLAGSAVESIGQDSRGYMWFGTYYGVSRFDGLKFKNFSIVHGIPGNYIWDIFSDGQKRLWLGTNEGCCFGTDSGGFHPLFPSTVVRREPLAVTAFAGDKHGGVFLGTQDGLFCVRGDKTSLFWKGAGAGGSRVNDALIDDKGLFWLGTDGGLVCFDSSRSHSRYYMMKEGLPSDTVTALVPSHEGGIWVGTDSGLARLKDGGVTTVYGQTEGLPHRNILSLMEDKDGNLWIGTQQGLSCFKDGVFQNYFTLHGFPGEEIHALFQDREGTIWFGTNLGVNRIVSLKADNITAADGLPGNVVWGISQDKEGAYWFGTDGGLCRLKHGEIRTFNNHEALKNGKIYALLIEPDGGGVWIGTDRGLHIMRHGELRSFTRKDGLPHDFVLSLADGGNGAVWIGTARGLCRLVDNQIKPPPFKCAGRSVRSIMRDKNGDLFFSDKDGFIKVSGDEALRCTTADGLVHNAVNAFHRDGVGRLWICTDGGLSCLVDGKFKNFTTADGLIHNFCYFALEDDQDNLWIGTVKGINRISGIHQDSLNIDVSITDLVTAEMSNNSYLKDAEGNIWFGCGNGVTRFDPQNVYQKGTRPPIYMDSLTVLGRNIPIEGEKSIVLEHDQNYIKFGFVGLSFISPEELRYRYRLIGAHGEWIETADRSVDYADLSHGDYSFEVLARNCRGLESPERAVVSFRILPPFWGTWWFRTLGGVVFLLLLAGIVLWRGKRVREKTLLEERNKQLVMAQKMELLGMLAGGAVHDLKNLLTTIFNYSGMASQGDVVGVPKGGPIEKIQTATATAIRLARQILAFTRKGDEELRAVNLPDLLTEIVDILAVMTPRKVSVHYTSAGVPIKMVMNPTHFQQVVMNLCINAADAMPDGGRVHISLSLHESGERVVLAVADTGVGMDAETRKRLFDPLFTTKPGGKGTGLGLFVVKEIVDRYDGKITVDSTPGKGTVFTVVFPLPGMEIQRG